MKRIIIVFAVLIAPLGLYSQEPETLNAETQRLWNAHTVVPKTDDIKELRAFLQYGSDNWMQMNGRIRTSEMWQRFHIEKNKATFEAADRIIALSENVPGEEPPPPKDRREYYGWDTEISDLTFALQKKLFAIGFGKRWNPNWQQQYRDFIEELKKNPAHKYTLKMAEMSWFSSHFSASIPLWVSDDEPASEKNRRIYEGLRLYEENFENLKHYFAENADDPYVKFQIDFHIHKQAAELHEESDNVKKGTLMKPMLEFYRSLYEKYPDAPEAEGYLRMINNDLVKYEILTADDQQTAWREAVEKLRQSLEEKLDEDSFQKVWMLGMIVEDLENRTEAGLLLYKTVRPIFAASSDPKLNDYAISFDITLSALAREGLSFEFEAVLIDGTKIDLKDYRGKVVLLYYWHTGCGPCIGELPTLKRIYEGWHDKGFEVISFSTDENIEHLKQFVEKEKLPWLNASEVLSKKANLADSRKKYDIIAYPTTILIDRDGKVIRGDARGAVLGKELRRLFADNLK